MNQNYKFKSLQIVKSQNNKDQKDEDFEKLTVFETGETKTIDFILLGGTRQNFPYSHYLTSWLGKESEERVIKIFFATHLVTIYGVCLDKIYNHLLIMSLKSVRAKNKRYLKTIEDGQLFVTDIKITWKKDT
ncbi:MAG: hypothetical protein AAFX55_18535 [Bacteroidota bacterium]